MNVFFGRLAKAAQTAPAGATSASAIVNSVLASISKFLTAELPEPLGQIGEARLERLPGPPASRRSRRVAVTPRARARRDARPR